MLKNKLENYLDRRNKRLNFSIEIDLDYNLDAKFLASVNYLEIISYIKANYNGPVYFADILISEDITGVELLYDPDLERELDNTIKLSYIGK